MLNFLVVNVMHQSNIPIYIYGWATWKQSDSAMVNLFKELNTNGNKSFYMHLCIKNTHLTSSALVFTVIACYLASSSDYAVDYIKPATELLIIHSHNYINFCHKSNKLITGANVLIVLYIFFIPLGFH